MQSLAKPKAQPFARNRALRDASWQAVYDAMKTDPAVHVFGEGAQVKAKFDAPQMLADFPDRIHTMPISEDGNLNFCVGAALMGCKPLCDVISADFLYRAMDSLVNTAAKLEGHTIVIRAETLLGGPTTGQRPEASLAHVPGLNVVIPSTPEDAYGLMATALAVPGVTVYFEDRMIEDAEFGKNIWLRESVPFGSLSVRLLVKGSHVAVLTYGVMRQRIERLLQAQGFDNDFYKEPDYRADLYDLQSIWPLPLDYLEYGHIFKRTSNLLIVEPDIQEFGVGAEIAAWVAERMPRIRVRRLGAKRSTISAAPSLQYTALPSDQEILDAIASF